MSGFQNDASYGQIKEGVLEQTGMKVSYHCIAQIMAIHISVVRVGLATVAAPKTE